MEQRQQQLSLNWVAGEKVVQNRLKNEKKGCKQPLCDFSLALHVYMGICFTSLSLSLSPFSHSLTLHNDEYGCIKWLQSIGLLVRSQAIQASCMMRFKKYKTWMTLHLHRHLSHIAAPVQMENIELIWSNGEYFCSFQFSPLYSSAFVCSRRWHI